MRLIVLSLIPVLLVAQAFSASSITVEQIVQSFEIKEKTLENSNMLYTRSGTRSDGTKTALAVALIKRAEQLLVEQLDTTAGSMPVNHVTEFYDGHRSTVWSGDNNEATTNLILPANIIWLAQNRLPEYIIATPLSKALRESKDVKIENTYNKSDEPIALITFTGAGKDDFGKLVGPQHKFEFRISLNQTLVLEMKQYLSGNLYVHQIVTQAKEIAPDIWIPEAIEVKNYSSRPPHPLIYSGVINLWKFQLVSDPSLQTISFTIPEGAEILDKIMMETFVKGSERREHVQPEEGSIISDYFDLTYSQVEARVIELASEQQ